MPAFADDHSPFRTARSPLVSSGQMDHHIADFTFTAAGDLSLNDLQTALAKQGQWFPIDGDPALPLSRLVETNSTGPLRLGYGAWRDLLLGCQFKTARGELITAGGRVIKNVAGYDLTKLMVGQLGTLGKIVTLTARAYRRPEAALLAVFPPDLSLVNSILPTSLRPRWMMLTPDALHFGYLGDEPAIDFFESRLPALNAIEIRRRTLNEDIDHRTSAWSIDSKNPARFRASVPPAKIAAFLLHAKINRPVAADIRGSLPLMSVLDSRGSDPLMSVLPDAVFSRWAADAAFGIVVGVAEDRSRLVEAATSVGGNVLFPNDVPSGSSPENDRLVDRLIRAFTGGGA